MNFKETSVFIEGNKKLREPQIEAYLKIQSHFKSSNEEALVVLPTGTGKSGVIAIAPFNVSEGRVLVITPGKVTRQSISKTMEVLNDNFWVNYDVVFDVEDLPVLVGYESEVLQCELMQADIIYTNVQKLSDTSKNSLLNRVNNDFFDMIIIDEAHHAPAKTWQKAIGYFNKAKVLHFTGTPFRGDGVKIPGKKIHETKLSEVMDLKYVKWLRNKTITSEKITFVDGNGNQLSVNEAKELHNEDWVRRSVAMSDECSLEVIEESISQLNEIKKHSPTVNHKIMASACTIKHAERISELYESKGMKVVLIHSDINPKEQVIRFNKIEHHQCDVVVNVGMMGEGYDHKYLTICALFRPYKSLNMFAQIVGRVLRVIPNDEIVNFGIDNNALVIYHKELGLDELWGYYKREMGVASDIAKIKERTITEVEYENREVLYGRPVLDGEKLESLSSYSVEIDFNKEFEMAKITISDELNKLKQQLEEQGIDQDVIDSVIEQQGRKKSKLKSNELQKIYDEKRPFARRKLIKTLVKEKIELAAAELLNEAEIDEKGIELFYKFKKFLPDYIKSGMKNDGVIVVFINTKLKASFGARNELNIDELAELELYLEENLKPEIRRMLNGGQS